MNNQKKLFFEFPRLTGMFKVGNTRRQFFYQPQNSSTNQRQLILNIWYPANIHEENPLYVYDKFNLDALTAKMINKGYKVEDLAFLDNIYTHSAPESEPLLNSNKFPVILFSHGRGIPKINIYTAICEELSSQGYFVVAIEHINYIQFARALDGQEILGDSSLLLGQHHEKDFCIWLSDIKNTISFLQRLALDKLDIFFNFFDMENVAIIGHSYGGAIAFQACIDEPYIKCGISLDGRTSANSEKSDLD
jgi:predicted dienelactone hydrolase